MHPHQQGTAVCHHSRKSELAHVNNALRARIPRMGAYNPLRTMFGPPYVAGLLGWIYKSHNVHMYHKLANTLRSMVVHPN